MKVMEIAGPKRPKRTRHRKRKKRLQTKHANRIKFEVMISKRQKGSVDMQVYNNNGSLINNSMEANSFWENYAAAQEWQRRHSVTWWRARCHALEYENNILKEKIRNFLHCNPCNKPTINQIYDHDLNTTKHNGNNNDDDSENDLIFQMNDDMIQFLEQSIRHKNELKEKKNLENSIAEKKEKVDKCMFEGGAAWIQERTEGALLLYGSASSKILAMETALQATNDRHKDKAKPHYWPNIPLNL